MPTQSIIDQLVCRVVGTALAMGIVGVVFAACSGSSSAGSSTVSPEPFRVNRACPSALVHYGAIRGGAGQRLPTRLPWVAGRSARIVGVLFYFGARPFRSAHLTRAVISTGGATLNSSTKILWWMRGVGLGHPLAITGHRLDGSGWFHQQASTALGTATHPSIVTVPTPGCWQFRLTSGGTSDDVTFQAVALHS